MALAKKKCNLCDEILLPRAVPLCKATRNRELTEKKLSTAGSNVLSDLLRSVGIGICNAASEESRSAACKECARKIFNCCTMFHELESAVKARIDVGYSESTEGGIKRLHGGSTPNSKKIKDIPQQVQEPREPKGRSRKSLFHLEADWTERENIEGAIANLMCLPVTTTKDEIAPRPVVKIFMAYCSGRVIEHECTGDEELLVKKLRNQKLQSRHSWRH
ncbi:unnamed protein product [Porites evermanni]|uniref:Uncharacterized protein n=1 Tax=Porites evermanni TaxID=104178 RepID=A0ABN8LZS5_9CNID|nr:unnamed protein product [Porites evermanni]